MHPRWVNVLVASLGLVVVACNSSPRKLDIERPAGHWKASGFTKMVPPLRLPGYRNRRDRTEVWLKLPVDGVIETLWLADQNRHVLRFPSGTDAVRVEYRAWGDRRESWEWGVADVRGTRIEAEGQRFYALRPIRNQPGVPLSGYEWQRDDADAARRASEQLIEMVAKLASPERRAHATAKAKSTNQCATCHSYSRPRNSRSRQFGLVNRATDASGFVLVQTVLEGSAPLETYFPVEHNLDDPFIRFVCDGDRPANREKSARPTCPGGRVPIGTLDVKAARSAGDRRVQELCTARRYLREHLDETGRKVFQSSFVECGL